VLKLTSLSVLAVTVMAAGALLVGGGAAARTAHPHRTTSTKTAAARGLAFAQDHCATCHGVTANSSSPNPEAPPWDDVANRAGTSVGTVAAFLSDAHNYPAAMDFKVQRTAIRDLATYMLTLRTPGYRPTR